MPVNFCVRFERNAAFRGHASRVSRKNSHPVWFARRLRGRITVVGEKLIPHVVGIKLVERDRVEKPHLIARTAGSDIKATFSRIAGECLETLIRCGDQAQEDYVALVSLKRTGVTTNQLALFNFFGRQMFQKKSVDELGPFFTLK